MQSLVFFFHWLYTMAMEAFSFGNEVLHPTLSGNIISRLSPYLFLQFKKQGTLCRGVKTDCDVPEYCTGGSRDVSIVLSMLFNVHFFF